jgi:hypothetical protein
MRVKLNKINQHKLWLNDEIIRQQNFNKKTKKEIKNQKNKDWDEENNIWEIAIKGLN